MTPNLWPVMMTKLKLQQQQWTSTSVMVTSLTCRYDEKHHLQTGQPTLTTVMLTGDPDIKHPVYQSQPTTTEPRVTLNHHSHGNWQTHPQPPWKLVSTNNMATSI